jgi:hypothetical protein
MSTMSLAERAAFVHLPLYRRKRLVSFAATLRDRFTIEKLVGLRWFVAGGNYPMCRTGDKTHYLHHLVFAHYYGTVPSGLEIDHKDGDKFNCLPDNLRACTRSVNIANSGKRTTNKSGFKGVSWDKANGKWRASIMVNYRCINLGRYANKEDAARAVNDAYRRYFPEVRIPNLEVE